IGSFFGCFESDCEIHYAHKSVLRMTAGGHTYHIEIGVQKIFAMAAVAHAIVDEQVNHYLLCCFSSVCDVFSDAFFPFSVAFDAVAHSTEVTSLVAGAPG